MIYIDQIQNPSGAYPNPKTQPFPGCIALTEEQAKVFFAYNGFVVVDGDTVTPNNEAWEAWKAEQAAKPDSEEEQEGPEPTVWDELDAAYQEGVDSV